MLEFANIEPRERVIVALDCDMSQALDLADVLQGHAKWLKVGMTLYYAQGPRIVNELKGMGYNIFLDLKFHDIPHQVRGAAASATRNGADMITMHAVGGVDMMRAALEGAQGAADDFGLDVPVTLGITVLTSMDATSLSACGVERPLEDQVLAMASLARDAGLAGVVASPQEASALRAALGPEAFIVTPGVRPAGSARGDQQRVATPAQAFEAGASHIVVGRPITEASDPLRAFEDIASTLQDG